MRFGLKRFSIVVGLLGIALALSGGLAQAADITQWSFNANYTNNAKTWPTSNYSVGSSTLNVGTPNSPAPTWGSGTAITLGMTNPYNGGSQAADDFPATTGTADPSYSETLWRVRATSPVANGDNNVLPNGNVSTNAWALFNIASPTAHDGTRNTARASSWTPAPLDIRTSVSASIGTPPRRASATCSSSTAWTLPRVQTPSGIVSDQALGEQRVRL